MALSSSKLSIMGIEDNGQQEPVATFITKLWKIVEKRENNSLIFWSETGRTFVVQDSNKFSKEILPYYFKHSNFNSFVRQLNLYGFRKIAKPEYGSLTKSRIDEPLEFWHTNFRRGHPELLHLVQRRVPHKDATRTEGDKTPHHLSVVMSDIHQMKGRQEGIASMLDALKVDNTHLRHEIGVLKDKHIRQQKILNKIIHFLVHMVYKGKIPASRRPSRPANRLMLMDSEALQPPPKKLKMASSGDPIDELTTGDLDSPFTELAGLSPATTMLTTLSSSLLNPTSIISVPPVVTAASPSSKPPSVNSPSSSNPPSVDSPSSKPPSITSVFSDLSSSSLLPSTSSSSNLLSSSTSYLPSSSPSYTYTSPVSPLPEMQFPSIPETLLEVIAMPPAPSSLVPAPHPENRMCINGQLSHQQLGLDNLQDVLSGHLSVDPSLVSDFVLSEEFEKLPDYDFIDTARLLESLSSSEDADISHDSTLNTGALVPVQGSGGTTDSSLQSDILFSQPQMTIISDSDSLHLEE